MDLMTICKKAREASFALAGAESVRNDALENISKQLITDMDMIISENAKDIENAKAKGISEAMLDRLTLTEERIKAISCAVLKVKGLPDVLGKGEVFTRPNGLVIRKVSVP